MTLRPGFPAVSRAATQFDIRAALRATTAQDANGTIKTGVSITANSLAGLVTPGQGMNSNIAKFDAILDRYGPIFLSNDGTITIKHDPAPSANSRIDLITVKQHETATPASDPTDGPQITIIKGTPAVDPTTPATPEGALALASVLIPATATSMASEGVIYTQLYPFTAAAGADLLFRTKTEMDKWTPWDGQKAKLLTDDTEYAGSDGAWVSLTQRLNYSFGGGSLDILLGAYSCTVQVRNVKIGGGSWDSLTASQTVPESHRPPTEMDGPLMTANGGSATGFLVVSTNGQIRVANMGSSGSTDTRNGQVSWPV